MTDQTKTTFSIVSWDEAPFKEFENGSKFTRASIKKSYEGVIKGDGILEYLMFYRDEQNGVFMGIEQITGEVDGKSGSFVIQHDGTFAANGVKATFSVVLDSGIGELINLSGKGEMDLPGHMEKYPMTFDYALG